MDSIYSSLCFNHPSESDSDAVFLSFLFKMLLFIETYPHSSVDKKIMHEANYLFFQILFKCSNIHYMFEYIRIFIHSNIQQNILGAMKVLSK